MAFKNDGFKRQLLEDTPQSRIDASADMKNHVTNAAALDGVPDKMFYNFDAKKVKFEVIIHTRIPTFNTVSDMTTYVDRRQ